MTFKNLNMIKVQKNFTKRVFSKLYKSYYNWYEKILNGDKRTTKMKNITTSYWYDSMSANRKK